MTEEQIIKAFEHCNILHKCDNCPSLRDGGRVCLTPDIDKQLKKKCKDINTAREIIKSEAIKEFAEKLTDKISVYSKYVDVDGIVILNRIFRMIEDIEKEMTEGNNIIKRI